MILVRRVSAICLASSLPLAWGQTMMDFLGQMPACAVSCFSVTLANSTCVDVTDMSCLCVDKPFVDLSEACVVEACEPMEAMDVARAQDVTCKHPIRSRKNLNLKSLPFEVVVWCCPLLRLFGNWKIHKRITLDDWMMAGCWVLYSALVTTCQTGFQLAFGQDIWNVAPKNITTGMRLFFVDQSIYLVVLALTKVAVLCFYRRIFPQKWFRRAIYVTMAIVIISSTVLLFAQIFQCSPVHLMWTGWKLKNWEAQCMDIHKIATSAGSFNIALESVIILLPMPLLAKLKTSTRTKIGVFFMFSLGIFVIVTSCIRLRYLLQFGHTYNPTWDYADLIMWSGVEVGVSIMIACLPALRALLVHMVPKLMTSARSQSSREGPGSGASGAQTISIVCVGRNDTGREFERGFSSDEESQIGLNEMPIEKGDSSMKSPIVLDRAETPGGNVL